MIGKNLSHYEVLSRLGQGGMGEVYKARDTRLGREVAVKVLPAEVSESRQALARFKQEARAVAALSHPNILVIFDFGTDQGVSFAVTELLEGSTLREVLEGGPLPEDKILDYAAQVLSGLAASHDRGIVHRDLKPENLFVTTDGRVKILDFGLARIMSPETEGGQDRTLDMLTAPQVIVGTVGYMSPEQVRGVPVGPASDLFAFGIIAFEMITGRQPFRKASKADTLSSILRDEPSIGREHQVRTSAEFIQLVQQCLAKVPAGRPESARWLLGRLKDLHSSGSRSPGAAADPIDSIAVLPFENTGGDPNVEFLSDGLTDTLIDNLCRLPRLRVMARSSVFQLKDTAGGPIEMGRALGVRGLLTGRLLQRGDRLSIRVELVDSRDGSRLWGERFDQPLSDLSSIEDHIAREISDHLRLELNREEKAQLTRSTPRNPEAHQAYLQGRFVWNRWKTPEGMQKAIKFFERALTIDPEYARAYAGLADAHSMLGNVKAVPPDEAYPRAKQAAMQGLAIDDSLAELHSSLGFIHRFWDWDWDASEQAFKRAIDLNPQYPIAHRFYGQLLSGLGQHDRAIVEANQAVALDPMSLIIIGAAGDVFFYAGQYEEAIRRYRRTLEVDPDFVAGKTDLARALELAGQYDEAIELFKSAQKLVPKGPPEPSSGLAHVYAQMGRREEALEILARIMELRKTRYISPYGIASIHACLGDNVTALDWLEQAYDQHDQTLVWVKVHPRLKGLHKEPRYLSLLEKMNLAG